ncbi:MAG TPA: MBL fold metallo-hydrolase, partial [Candidatus Binatia bacterium]
GVDLFICESSFYQGDDPAHMSYETVKEKLPQLACKKLVLTHMGEKMLSHRNEIPEQTAEDGMVVEI